MRSQFLLPAIVSLALLLVGCTSPPPRLPYNGLAKTPPMGWNSWNYFKNTIDDQIVRSVADAMVSSGMRDAGYIYVNIDDTWQGARDAEGNLTGNQRFPNMKALADYVHSKGLKLGIYSSPGQLTCSGYPGSYGHEDQDAKTFADWGVDYLKYDWCSADSVYDGISGFQWAYWKMGYALQATGRPIVYSICDYGVENVEEWGADVGGNLWRTTSDISDSWDSMLSNIDGQAAIAPYAASGHWNDPDMLEIGNGQMTDDEYRTQMSLWALAAAPLLAGNDVRTMSASTESILLNAEVIAVDQDPLGIQASPVMDGNLETWIKPMADGSVVAGIVNLGVSATQATVTANGLGLVGAVGEARDLWQHTEIQFTGGTYLAALPPHGVLLLKVRTE
jgi:alpha-galactosidase